MAAWASIEVVEYIRANIQVFLGTTSPRNISIYTSKEGTATWPIADGVIIIEENGQVIYQLALEFKRKNEGVHGVLTSLGQAHTYLHKGYSGSIIVIPETYDTHTNPGSHLASVIDLTSSNAPIAVFVYKEPDVKMTSPFQGKLTCLRKFDLTANSMTGTTRSAIPAYVKTQWAHLREGSSDADAFYKYLQTAKHSISLTEPNVTLPPKLEVAVHSLSPGMNPLLYLSNSIGHSIHDVIWRNFWFKYAFTESVMHIWTETTPYVVNDHVSEITLPNGTKKMFFAGRSDSIKNKLVRELNLGTITEDLAWERFAHNVRDRAHSYREDIDSGLSHIGLLDSDGRPTDLGYRFVDACERTGDPNDGTARSLLGVAILRNGKLGALLHYIYRLSEELFVNDPLAFSQLQNRRGNMVLDFQQDDYLTWLEDQLANKLNVMRKVSLRGGSSRKPLQGELAVLRQLGFVGKFRAALGLQINWPIIESTMDIDA